MNHISSLYCIAVILIKSALSGYPRGYPRYETTIFPSTGCGSDQYQSTINDQEAYLIHDGIERKYITHFPSSYDHHSVEGYPLVLNLHGGSSNGWEMMMLTLMNDHADENDYIAVYPDSTSLGTIILNGSNISLSVWNNIGCSASPTADGPTCNQFWTPSALFGRASFFESIPVNCKDTFGCNYCDCNIDDVGFIDILLDELEEKYCIDRSRIYVTGGSNGGAMTQTLGCELNHRLAAIAPVHGQNVLGYNCKPKYRKPMPILNIWGTQDEAQPGDTIIAKPLDSLGQFRQSVYQVMYKYGQHNKCNADNKKYVTIPSVSDDIHDWKCVGYDECDFDNDGVWSVDAMSCSWNGGHVYPVDYEEEDSHERDFGLNVIWNFFQDKTKVPPGYQPYH